MPDSFFLFCPVNSEERKSWLGKILIENQIYFRSREQLNDPNELRPRITFDGTDKQIRNYVRRLLSEGPNHLSPAQRLLEENKFIYRLRNTPTAFEAGLHDLLDRVGLLCLSESSMNTLLWAHYADGHRGVCIEFDAHVGLFSTAQQVLYSDQVPLVNRLADSNEEILQKCMFTKHADWAYEKEWRVIARWNDAARIQRYLSRHEVPESVHAFMNDQHGSGYYSFPSGAIRSIILGSRVEVGTEKWLREMLSESGLEMTIRKQKGSGSI